MTADPLQDVPGEDGHAARRDGHAQPVGRQQEDSVVRHGFEADIRSES